ncbi:ROK family protein [Catenulispora yoronensis]
MPSADHRPPPARQGTIRETNLALLYRLILDAPAPVSRAALAAATGMTRATASTLADALLAAGLAAAVAPPPAASAGRPAAGLVAARTGPAGLGLEVNVDYLAACVVDLSGTVRATATRHADQRGREVGAVLAELADLAREVAVPGLTPVGTALAVPGLVQDPVVAVPGAVPIPTIQRAPNLGWQDVEVTDELRKLLPGTPLPLAIGNEADFAALAEAHAETAPVLCASAGLVNEGPGNTGVAAAVDRSAQEGAATQTADFLYVSGEIGVGAGIVLGGEVFRGARGWAGEIGHVTVEPGGVLCRCGARGCLETVAGLEALRRSGAAVAAAALGRAIAAAVNLFDLPAVVLGGVYARPDLAAELVPRVAAALAEHVVSAAWAPVTVRASRWGEAAAAVGAATAVVRQVHADPAAWVGIS